MITSFCWSIKDLPVMLCFRYYPFSTFIIGSITLNSTFPKTFPLLKSAGDGLYKQAGDKLRFYSKSRCDSTQPCIDLVKSLPARSWTWVLLVTFLIHEIFYHILLINRLYGGFKSCNRKRLQTNTAMQIDHHCWSAV